MFPVELDCTNGQLCFTFFGLNIMVTNDFYTFHTHDVIILSLNGLLIPSKGKASGFYGSREMLIYVCSALLIYFEMNLI